LTAHHGPQPAPNSCDYARQRSLPFNLGRETTTIPIVKARGVLASCGAAVRKPNALLGAAIEQSKRWHD
jgi:hypothetical protein